MQNKANLKRARMNENLFTAKDYENEPRLRAPGKQTQFKANFKGKKMLLRLTINSRCAVLTPTCWAYLPRKIRPDIASTRLLGRRRLQ